MYYVYLIKSLQKNWFYIGYTDNITNRLKKHNTYQVRSTKAHAPLKLIYFEAYNDKTSAKKREIQLKKNSQQKEILFKKLSIL